MTVYAKQSPIGLSTATLFALLLLPSATAKDGIEFDGSVGVEYGNDNNVVVEEIDLTTSEGDSFFRWKLKGGAEYQFDQKHSLSANLSLTDKRFSDADAFDLQTLLFTAGYRFKADKQTFGLDLRRADAELGGQDFLTLEQISPFTSFFVDKKHFFRLAYTHIDKTLEDNPDRNANSHEFALDYYFFWRGLSDYLISGVKFRQENADEAQFNYEGLQWRFAYKTRYQLMDLLSRLTLDFRYRERDYSDSIDPGINAFRKDTRRTLSLNNELEVSGALSFVVDLTYINNQSNLPSLDYSETILSTGIEYQF